MDPKREPIVFRLGDFFFRWRSYLPFLVAPILWVSIATTQHRFASHAADVVWEISTLTLAVAGLALRAWTVGVAAPGTSGRNTRQQKARTLNTTGPYSMVRHPLYLANWLIVLALALFPHTWLAAPVVASVTACYYVCIAKREEAFLREQFGIGFEEWAARVPAFIPRVSLTTERNGRSTSRWLFDGNLRSGGDSRGATRDRDGGVSCRAPSAGTRPDLGGNRACWRGHFHRRLGAQEARCLARRRRRGSVNATKAARPAEAMAVAMGAAVPSERCPTAIP